MTCIIKKSVISEDGTTDTMEIIYKSAIFPCKVSENEDENRELKKYLVENYGPGKYYVYMMGGGAQFRKYFHGVVTMQDAE